MPRHVPLFKKVSHQHKHPSTPPYIVGVHGRTRSRVPGAQATERQILARVCREQKRRCTSLSPPRRLGSWWTKGFLFSFSWLSLLPLRISSSEQHQRQGCAAAGGGERSRRNRAPPPERRAYESASSPPALFPTRKGRQRWRRKSAPRAPRPSRSWRRTRPCHGSRCSASTSNVSSTGGK